MGKTLITFVRRGGLESNADLSEKIGNFGLGLLRVGFGKTITVEKISTDVGKANYKEKKYSIIVKIAAVALFIFALPFTLILSGIGCIGVGCSKSHSQIFQSYKQNIEIVPNSDHDNMQQLNAVPVIRPVTFEDHSATIIQKYIRGYLVRKSHLPIGSFPRYRAQCERIKGHKSGSIPKAQTGKTPVFLPEEMREVVLKRSGQEMAKCRFHQMQDIRSILNSQKSSHLIIPKANLCKEFLVEERLPINVDSLHNMGLYLSEPHLFDEAVREMTRLFSKVYLSDLVTRFAHPLGHIAGVEDFVRYDNLPLYVVDEKGERKGKIGLIDLEHMHKVSSSKSLDTLVRIFPLHQDVIKQEATQLKMQVNESSFFASAERGTKYLQVGYSDHLNWLQQKGVSTEISLQSFQVDPQRVDEVATLIEQELLKLNQGVNDQFTRTGYLGEPEKGFLKENPEIIAKTISKSITERIIQNLKNKLGENLKTQLSGIQTNTMTESQLVSFRSPLINYSVLYKGVFKLIEKAVEGYCSPFEEDAIGEQLMYVVMQELARGGEIFYFDPAYYAYGYKRCWVRY